MEKGECYTTEKLICEQLCVGNSTKSLNQVVTELQSLGYSERCSFCCVLVATVGPSHAFGRCTSTHTTRESLPQRPTRGKVQLLGKAGKLVHYPELAKLG